MKGGWVPMAGWGDKVEEGVDSVIPESRVPFNSGFLGEDIVVLSFQVACYLRETSLVINLISKPRRIDNRQRNASPLFLEIYTQSGPNSNTHAQK